MLRSAWMGANFLILAMALAACLASPGRSGVVTAPGRASVQAPGGFSEVPALRSLLAARDGFLTTGSDRIEVWVCRVPQLTRAKVYNAAPLRLLLKPKDLARVLNDHLPAYFSALSDGAYTPSFVAGGQVQMSRSDGPDECLKRALNKSDDRSTAVLAVATAEHRADVHGGLGTPGTECHLSCSAKATGRGVYVGASDFHPDWGSVPALDLVEHEIGHMLGWPHSGNAENGYASDLDLMSDSAAPRKTDPTARHGGATLGVNRLAAGWIPAGDVFVAKADKSQSTVELRPSTASSGRRLAILPIARQRFLTVELLTNTGVNRHLPHAGIAVTVVDQSRAVCGDPCWPVSRAQYAIGDPPYTDLLDPNSGPWRGDRWQVTVDVLTGQRATVTVRFRPAGKEPASRGPAAER